MLGLKLEFQCYSFYPMFLFLMLHIAHPITTTDDISNHIKNCCDGGKALAKKQNNCKNYDALSIPPLWRGLCHSTYAVCCSHELNKMYCIAGRLAALTGSRCNEQFFNTSYSDCCRACQVGLAVKASGNICSDTFFSYFFDIKSFRVCCNSTERNWNESLYVNSLKRNSSNVLDATNTDIFNDNKKNVEGTIILQESDDDICAKFLLCEQICENTRESYICKCYPGYKLNDNMVTCTPVKINTNYSNRLESLSFFNTFKGIIGMHNSNKGLSKYQDDIDVDDKSNADVQDKVEKIFKTTICPTGFYTDPLQPRYCIDIDECMLKLHDCKTFQYCININGSFRCVNQNSNTCKPGLILNKGTKKCSEIRRETETSAVTVLVFNNESTKHALKKCEDGFYWNNSDCVDVNECEINDAACDNNQVCINNIGGYHCDCRIGFNLDMTTKACIDINECSINNHNCLPTQRCDNTLGSYVCTRLQSCGTGYTLNADSGTCDDNDECALNTHNCKEGWECYNTKGSFRCFRKSSPSNSTTSTTKVTSTTSSHIFSTPWHGLHLSSYHKYDNTSTNYGSYPLPKYISGQISNYQSYENRSSPSFYLKGFLPCEAGPQRNRSGACVDINECESGEHNCIKNRICRNRIGGFLCSCPPGHHLTYLPNGESQCVDINECEKNETSLCAINAKCINTIGSYFCECKPGFQKRKGNERMCLDVNECNEIPGICHQKCINFFGGYRCTCNNGYKLGSDNRTCIDIDECEMEQAHKLCMGFCNNVPGSYECSCPRGYILASDRNTCLDIDECATEEICTGRNDVCINKRGGYKCTTVQCPFGYTNESDKKTRCRLTKNLCEDDNCYNKPSAYTYNFITFVSKITIPPEGRTFFSLKGPAWCDNIEFYMKVVRVQAAANIEKATYNHFGSIKEHREIHLTLKRSLEGPQEIEIDLTMTVFTKSMPRGKSVAKIFIIVSQYTF